MFSLNFMFFCSLIEELCTKEENSKTSCNFNFGHECNFFVHFLQISMNEISSSKKLEKLSFSDVDGQPAQKSKKNNIPIFFKMCSFA